MKYAIVSDIHGNNTALQAVLADAAAQKVDKYLFLGDYTFKYSQGNEAVDTLRKVTPAVVIKGNGEGYYADLIGKNFHELTNEQMKPLYWGYKVLSPQNLEYVMNLPQAAAITDNGYTINLSHACSLFFRPVKIELFHSRNFRAIMTKEPFTHEHYLLFARAVLLSCPGVLEELGEMPEGIYLFGHNHLQFHMEYEGRLFINPGGCGDPLDFDTRAPYTILNIDDTGWQVEERRVEYDISLVTGHLDSSGFTEYAPVWSEITKLQLQTAKDYMEPFILHLEETGRKMGEYKPPVSNAAWDEAVKTWDVRRISGSSRRGV